MQRRKKSQAEREKMCLKKEEPCRDDRLTMNTKISVKQRRIQFRVEGKPRGLEIYLCQGKESCIEWGMRALEGKRERMERNGMQKIKIVIEMKTDN